MLRKDTPKMARDPVAVFWIPENRDPMINDMITTWISLWDHELVSHSGLQLCNQGTYSQARAEEARHAFLSRSHFHTHSTCRVQIQFHNLRSHDPFLCEISCPLAYTITTNSTQQPGVAMDGHYLAMTRALSRRARVHWRRDTTLRAWYHVRALSLVVSASGCPFSLHGSSSMSDLRGFMMLLQLQLVAKIIASGNGAAGREIMSS
jgi:hypothetical protein